MHAELKTLRQVALASPELTLDLKRFDADIALTMQARVKFDTEDSGRLIWIVDEPDQCWAVSMPGDASDIEAITEVDRDEGTPMQRAGMTWSDFV